MTNVNSFLRSEVCTVVARTTGDITPTVVCMNSTVPYPLAQDSVMVLILLAIISPQYHLLRWHPVSRAV